MTLVDIVKSAWTHVSSNLSNGILVYTLAAALGAGVTAKANSLIFEEKFESKTEIKNNGGSLIGDKTIVKGVDGNAMDCAVGKGIQYPLGGRFDSNAGTVEIWVRPPWGNPFGFWDVGVVGFYNANIGIFKNQDDLILEIAGGDFGWDQVRARRFPYDNKWHFISGTWEMVDDIMYYKVSLDGRVSSVRSRKCDFRFDDHWPMTLGWCGWYGNSQSVIDECKIYDYPKTAQEIKDAFLEQKLENAPFVTSFFPEDIVLHVDPNTLMTFSVEAVDPKGDDIDIFWTANHTPFRTGPELLYQSPPNGTDIVRARITDGAFEEYKEWVVYVSNPKIMDNQLIVDGAPFTIKGIIYDPSPSGKFGPWWARDPLPGRDVNITHYVSKDDKVRVTDYDGDGIIKMWELVKYDMELIKSLGVNTIRITDSGDWRDKNLNGIENHSADWRDDEFIQKATPTWVIDDVVDFCEQNNMKVIISYGVHEENYWDEKPDTPSRDFRLNWEDVVVAKQGFGRIVNRYKDSPAVLAWAIGDGIFFTHEDDKWKVPPYEYLYELFSFIKSLDDRPIMYNHSKNELKTGIFVLADIVAIDASTTRVADLPQLEVPPWVVVALGDFKPRTQNIAEDWDHITNHMSGAFFSQFNDQSYYKYIGTGYGVVSPRRDILGGRFNALKQVYTSQ